MSLNTINSPLDLVLSSTVGGDTLLVGVAALAGAAVGGFPPEGGGPPVAVGGRLDGGRTPPKASLPRMCGGTYRLKLQVDITFLLEIIYEMHLTSLHYFLTMKFKCLLIAIILGFLSETNYSLYCYEYFLFSRVSELWKNI